MIVRRGRAGGGWAGCAGRGLLALLAFAFLSPGASQPVTMFQSKFGAWLSSLDESGGLTAQFNAGGGNLCVVTGFVCNAGGDVVEINLAQAGITGTLTRDNFIYESLTALEKLDLSGNSLTGTIPSNLSKLPAIKHLDLSFNQFSGEVPTFSLSAGSPRFNSLEYIDLSNNQLTGELRWPWSLMPAVKHINVANNQISGRLPASWFADTAYPNLEFMDLSGNGADLCAGGAGSAALLARGVGFACTADASDIGNLNLAPAAAPALAPALAPIPAVPLPNCAAYIPLLDAAGNQMYDAQGNPLYQGPGSVPLVDCAGLSLIDPSSGLPLEDKYGNPRVNPDGTPLLMPTECTVDPGGVVVYDADGAAVRDDLGVLVTLDRLLGELAPAPGPALGPAGAFPVPYCTPEGPRCLDGGLLPVCADPDNLAAVPEMVTNAVFPRYFPNLSLPQALSVEGMLLETLAQISEKEVELLEWRIGDGGGGTEESGGGGGRRRLRQSDEVGVVGYFLLKDAGVEDLVDVIERFQGVSMLSADERGIPVPSAPVYYPTCGRTSSAGLLIASVIALVLFVLLLVTMATLYMLRRDLTKSMSFQHRHGGPTDISSTVTAGYAQSIDLPTGPLHPTPGKEGHSRSSSIAGAALADSESPSSSMGNDNGASSSGAIGKSYVTLAHGVGPGSRKGSNTGDMSRTLEGFSHSGPMATVYNSSPEDSGENPNGDSTGGHASTLDAILGSHTASFAASTSTRDAAQPTVLTPIQEAANSEGFESTLNNTTLTSTDGETSHGLGPVQAGPSITTSDQPPSSRASGKPPTWSNPRVDDPDGSPMAGLKPPEAIWNGPRGPVPLPPGSTDFPHTSISSWDSVNTSANPGGSRAWMQSGAGTQLSMLSTPPAGAGLSSSFPFGDMSSSLPHAFPPLPSSGGLSSQGRRAAPQSSAALTDGSPTSGPLGVLGRSGPFTHAEPGNWVFNSGRVEEQHLRPDQHIEASQFNSMQMMDGVDLLQRYNTTDGSGTSLQQLTTQDSGEHGDSDAWLHTVPRQRDETLHSSLNQSNTLRQEMMLDSVPQIPDHMQMPTGLDTAAIMTVPQRPYVSPENSTSMSDFLALPGVSGIDRRSASQGDGTSSADALSGRLDPPVTFEEMLRSQS